MTHEAAARRGSKDLIQGWGKEGCSWLTSRNKTQTRVGGGQGVRGMGNTRMGFVRGSGSNEFVFPSPFCSPATPKQPLECPDVHWQLLAMTQLRTKATRHCQLLHIHYYVYDTWAYLTVSDERILFHLAQEHHWEWEMPLLCKFHLNG